MSARPPPMAAWPQHWPAPDPFSRPRRNRAGPSARWIASPDPARPDPPAGCWVEIFAPLPPMPIIFARAALASSRTWLDCVVSISSRCIAAQCGRELLALRRRRPRKPSPAPPQRPAEDRGHAPGLNRHAAIRPGRRHRAAWPCRCRADFPCCIRRPNCRRPRRSRWDAGGKAASVHGRSALPAGPQNPSAAESNPMSPRHREPADRADG